MLNTKDILETIGMIHEEHLDIRTITMGISLLDCSREDGRAACEAVYDKICRRAEKLVSTGEAIEKEYGIPIINKRISVTPVAMVSAASAKKSAAIEISQNTTATAAVITAPITGIQPSTAGMMPISA